MSKLQNIFKSKKRKLRDVQIIAAIKKGGREEHQYLKAIYAANFPNIERFVINNQGDEAEAKDVFQEGLVVFYKNIKANKFRGDSSISTYLYAICKFIWYKKLKQKERYTTFEPTHQVEFERSPHADIINTEQQKLMTNLFGKLGEQCKEILLLAIYYDYSMSEIAQKMNFKNEQNARNKKYKCLKGLKKMIKENPSVQQILTELRN